MEKLRKLFSGGIRMKIFSMLLITILLIIAAYTAILFYQSNKVEQLVEDSYELQQQLFAESGLEDHSERVWNESVEVFRRGMFHARNILILLVALIVVTGLASAFSISSQITDPLNMITKRVASLGVSNRRFEMEDAYRTGDEIEVLAESFAKQSARTELYRPGQKSHRGKGTDRHGARNGQQNPEQPAAPHVSALPEPEGVWPVCQHDAGKGGRRRLL